MFQTSEVVHYDFMPPIDQARLRHASGIYLAVAPDDDLARLHAHFDSVQLISTIWRNRNGAPIDAYRVYELKGYRGGLPC